MPTFWLLSLFTCVSSRVCPLKKTCLSTSGVAEVVTTRRPLNLRTSYKVLLDAKKMTSHLSTNHKKKSCLLFYVYAYCCGTCTGIIAVSLAFMEVSAPKTRVLIVLALVISIFSFLAHVAVSKRPQTPNVVMVRTLLVGLGLVASAVLSGVSAFFNSGTISLLFVCCTLFGIFYISACVGYILNVQMHWRNGAPQTNVTSASSSGAVSQVYMTTMYSPYEVFSSELVQRQGDGVHASCRTDMMLRVPAVSELPSYEQLQFPEPPKYWEVASSMELSAPEQISSELELPPKYEDIAQLTDTESGNNANEDIVAPNQLT
ncbi:hypothetical protein BgiBS90_004533 [Biomphalaria glabrata]|nr:hypothetical protein BgiBS90_004533 [Biomphalaria glabrata]